MLCIGLMSGTSADGIDACLVDISSTSIKYIDALCLEYPLDFHKQLRQLASADFIAPEEIAITENQLADLSSSAVNQLLERNKITASNVASIGNHGHTIRHRQQPCGFSWQISNHAQIAEQTGITCIGDFRRRDIAAGGEGAPLAPAFHKQVFGQRQQCAVVNIGGIANVTLFEPELIGFDTGPGNALINEWCEQAFQTSYDDNGDIARSGKVQATLLEDWLQHPYFELSPPKSTGREVFSLSELKGLSLYSPEDIACTLTELTAISISSDILNQAPDTQELLVCGGGAHNGFLMERLASLLTNTKITSTEAAGIHPDWVEAMAFAWLGWKTLHQQPSNEPRVTGASGHRILGAIYYA